MAYVYQQVRGADPVLITAISLVAVVNGALIQIIMASRVCYGMGRKGWMPMWLARVNPVTRKNETVYQWVPALGAFGSLLFVVLQLLTASSGSR